MKRGTWDHPKTHMLARLLGIPLLHASGMLDRLFEWCSVYALSGYFGRWGAEDIARVLDWEGDPEAFLAAFITARWIDAVPATTIARTARYGPGDDPDFDLPVAADISPTADDGRQAPPIRRHLVLHDVADHAEELWRKRLARAGYTFWDGSPARGTPGRPTKKRSTGAGLKTGQKPDPAGSLEPVAGSHKREEEKKGGVPRETRDTPLSPSLSNPSGGEPGPGPGPATATAAALTPVATLVPVADPAALMRAWNRIATGLVPCHDMTPSRRVLARARLAERPALADWERIFTKMNQSPFLRGDNSWRWRAHFDWALKPERGLRVLEGQYDAAQTPSDLARARLAEVERRLKAGEHIP
jgi:hypothetical protein